MQRNVKQSLMPPPVFTSIPSLPMFVVESGDNRNSKQPDIDPLNLQSTSSGGIDSDSHLRSSRKVIERPNSAGDRSSGREEVLVHSRKHHHHHHRHKDPSPSEKSEVPADQFPKPKPRRRNQLPETEPARSRSGSRTALLKELDKLTRQNEDLSRNESQQNDVNIEELRAELIKLDTNYRNVEKQRDTYKEELIIMKSIQESEFEKMAALQTENQELHDDVTMLKNLVYRLNVELDRYQQKFHKQGGKGELPPLKTLPATVQEKEATLLWSNVNKNALKPLLDAYQETIREKDDLIKSYEQDLNKFVANCKQLDERGGNWHVLQEDSKLAQEQNEVLMNQVQLQKDKLKEVQTMYDERIAELTKDNEMLVNKFHQYRGELLTLKGQYSVVKEEYDKLKKDAENKVPFAVHSASVSECRNTLTSQVQELQSQKPHLEVQIENMTAENKQLQIHVKTLDRLLKRTQQRCEELQARLVTCQVSRDASKRQLQKAMSFAEELVGEQEKLLCQLHAKQEENKSIARLGTTIVYRMGSLKTKLKTVQKDAWAELDVVEKRIRRQETDVERMKDEYHHEVLRLRNLVKQKEVIIGRLQKEKTKTQEDLEVVWRAATSDDLRIKEKLKQASLLPEGESELFLKC
ncbi:hypothetical protein C0J52_04766 [Blattella germanica]|nr:hypothetical protein C0J52_04766 [Blattella germanica]